MFVSIKIVHDLDASSSTFGSAVLYCLFGIVLQY
uniref:Uncharacterized protein n=1 Tax=Rhizophora mucronata TaxID=61149 RepID=A0A2P2R0R1_RHIMU